MKLMAPVNSLESCIAQIDAGVDEIFVGYRVDEFRRMSFSSRPQTRGNKFIMPDKEEFLKIVNYASQRGVSTKLTANTIYFSDYSDGSINFEKLFLDYVLYGVECGIDAVIVSDIGLVSFLHKQKIPIEIYASTLLDTDSLLQMKFLKEIGVSRVVLAYQITLEELRCITSSRDMEIETFGYSGCSFGCGCMLGHGEEFGTPCENTYYCDGNTNEQMRIFSALNCGLCGLWDLRQMKIDAIKIPGREKDYHLVLPIVNLFRQAIDYAETAASKEEYLCMLKPIIPLWWKECFCKNNQCKYTDIEITLRSISRLGGEQRD